MALLTLQALEGQKCHEAANRTRHRDEQLRVGLIKLHGKVNARKTSRQRTIFLDLSLH